LLRTAGVAYRRAVSLAPAEQLLAASELVRRGDGVRARRLVVHATSSPDARLVSVLAGAKILLAVCDYSGALLLAARAQAMRGGAERGAALRFTIELRLGFYREARATLARLDAARHSELHERQLRALLRAGDLDGAAELLELLLAARSRDAGLLQMRAELEARRAAAVAGTARDDARVVLDTIRIAAPEVVLARLEAVQARYPTSGLPWAHHGEALTWLGRHEESRASLERAIAVDHRTRWPYYGLGVLHLVAGRPHEAIEMCARGYAALSNTDTPFEHAVRGEALRLLGRLDESATALRIALTSNPRRLSTHVNLGLVHAAAGRSRELDESFRHTAQQAPALLVAAAADCGVDLWRAEPGLPPWPGLADDERARILGAALSRMHGNRSASCLTWLNDEGVIRTVDGRRSGGATGRHGFPAARVRRT
jgi:tetratricopeptide (TPR) repeat protein